MFRVVCLLFVCLVLCLHLFWFPVYGLFVRLFDFVAVFRLLVLFSFFACLFFDLFLCLFVCLSLVEGLLVLICLFVCLFVFLGRLFCLVV